jgi:hypothetical protein
MPECATRASFASLPPCSCRSAGRPLASPRRAPSRGWLRGQGVSKSREPHPSNRFCLTRRYFFLADRLFESTAENQTIKSMRSVMDDALERGYFFGDGPIAIFNCASRDRLVGARSPRLLTPTPGSDRVTMVCSGQASGHSSINAPRGHQLKCFTGVRENRFYVVPSAASSAWCGRQRTACGQHRRPGKSYAWQRVGRGGQRGRLILHKL